MTLLKDYIKILITNRCFLVNCQLDTFSNISETLLLLLLWKIKYFNEIYFSDLQEYDICDW